MPLYQRLSTAVRSLGSMVEDVILLALRLRGPAGTEENDVDPGVEDVNACQRR
jgi:hypothetical protein